MPAPVAAAVAAIIATSAAKQLGTRIGDAIADGIFGRANDLKEIQKQLDKLSSQLQEVLHYARSTYELVENLPNIISGLLDQQTLYLAHNDIESSLQAYMRLQQWHGTIGYETLANLLKSWNIIIDKESSTEKIAFLPRYGEFMLLVTNGQLFDAVHNGVKFKLEVVDGLIDNLIKDQITPCATEIEGILKSEHVKSGSLLENGPWVAWAMQGHRTRTITECIERPCEYCNGSITRCFNRQIPDSTWNSTVDSKNSRLRTLAEKIGLFAKQLQSAVLAKEVLSRYLSLLDSRNKEKITLDHIKVIEAIGYYPTSEGNVTT